MTLDEKFIKFDLIKHKTSGRIGKVVDINRFFGWVKVQYIDGHCKHYTVTSTQRSIRKLNKEELADFRLKQETLGITNNWGE